MGFNPTVIERGLRIAFTKSMMRFQAARSISPGVMQSVMEIPSDGAYEKMGWIGAMPSVAQWIGEINAKEFNDYDYTIKNLDWVVGVPINENDVDDDQTGVLSSAGNLLAQRIEKHPEKLVINLSINGDSAVAYDGVAFFSNVTGARTIDNLLAGTGVTLSALETDLIAAMIAMAKFTDDQGEPLNIRGNLIKCPMALMYSFKKLIESKASPTASGGVDTYNPFAGQFTIIGDPRLDADDVNDWYLEATGEEIKPYIFSKRQGAKSRMERTPHTKNWVYSADYRGNGGYGLPHLAVKTVNT